MKDTEFIDLLNLYLDHEITPADAARLEAEVQANPARRRIYAQYCRMQKACGALAADFGTAPAAEGHDAKIIAFDAAKAEAAAARRKRAGSFYTLGTVAAAAACVAFVFVGNSNQPASGQPDSLAAAPAVRPTPTASPVALVTVTEGPRALGSQSLRSAPVVAGSLLHTSNSQHADDMMAVTLGRANGRFAWMQNVQLQPIPQPMPLDDLRFEAQPAALRPEGRQLGRGTPSGADVELAAFQFMK
jgi:hypothetical protein